MIAEEEEYYPKLSTKELAQHFEKTIEEAAPSKKIKVMVLRCDCFSQSIARLGYCITIKFIGLWAIKSVG